MTSTATDSAPAVFSGSRALNARAGGPRVVDEEDRLSDEVRRRAEPAWIDGAFRDGRTRADKQSPVARTRRRDHLADKTTQWVYVVALDTAESCLMTARIAGAVAVGERQADGADIGCRRRQRVEHEVRVRIRDSVTVAIRAPLA